MTYINWKSLKRIMCGGVVSLLLCGCKGNDTLHLDKTESIPGWKLDTSPITFKWYINFSWFSQQWGNDLTSQYITEKTGVNIDFITPVNDNNDNISAMIANEDLPDFITLDNWDYSIENLINKELVYPLNELAERYDVYFTKVSNKEKLDWYRHQDGNVYVYPSSATTIEEFENNKDNNTSNQTFLVRKDIYEAIGSPDMRNPEIFINALLKAKELFPEINGEALIPLGLHEFTESGNYSLESYLQNFLAIPYEVNNKLYDRYTDKEYIEWLKIFRRANELGLLAPDIFIDKRLQIEEKISNGRYFSLLYQRSDMATPQVELYKKDPNKIYIAVDGPSNSKLEEPKLESSYGMSGWTVTLISKNCKNPDRAIRFLSYLISEEGNKDLFLGKEGITWQSINGKEQFKPEIAELLNNSRNEFNNVYGAAHAYWMLMDKSIVKKWSVEELKPIKDMEDWTKGKAYNYSVYDKLNPVGGSEVALISKQIGGLWGDVLFRLITATDEETFENIFIDFLRLRNEFGYNKVQAYKQNKLAENKKKLNIID